MKAKRPWIILMLVLALSPTVKPSNVAALTIKVGYPQLSGGSMPLWVINEAKLDRRYGVDINSIYCRAEPDSPSRSLPVTSI